MTDSLLVVGGPAGICVALDEIRLLASALEAVANSLRPVGDPLKMAQSELDSAQLSLAFEMVTSGDLDLAPLRAAMLRASAALEDTRLTRRELKRAVLELKDQVLAAGKAYQEAERLVTQEFSDCDKTRADLLRAWLMPQQAALGPLGFLGTTSTLAVAMLVEAVTNKQGLAGALKLHHVSLRSVVLGWPLWAVPDSTTVTRFYYGLAAGVQGDGLTVELTAGEKRPNPSLTGAKDLITLIDQARAPKDAAAQISVSQITAADGHISWVVAIPGTRSLSLGSGSDPMDMSTNLRAVGGDTNAVGLAVVAAMDQVGVKAHEDVLLVGHSQGGLVAASLAANPDFTAAYNVAGVLTAGSPIGCIPLRPQVKVLALEHTQDVIPALDGAANPDTANQVTVTRDLSQADDPELAKQAKNLSVAHGTEAYAATAALVDASSQLSIQAWRQAAAPVLDPTAKVETQFFEMRRVDEKPPKENNKEPVWLAPAAPGAPYYESGGLTTHQI